MDLGQLVAAFTSDDSCWYRAQVMSMPEDGSVAVLILDFGDTVFVDMSNIAQLRPEYLNIRFQGIECRLAGIKPNE